MTRRRAAGRNGAMRGVVLALALALAACSSPTTSSSSERLPVTVRDFQIALSSFTVPPGSLTFVVHDQGPSTHEFIVARTKLPANALPLRPDGLTIDEDSPQIHVVGEIGDIDIGDTDALSLRLAPGQYVLFCNIEGHYLGGMHAAFEVRGDAPRP